ncbi:MAG: hypothetical protein PHW62_00775 [Candidatus Ratteibacteria bacterium]|nr:hypothetical protein [Candidatus Ratteibacteria bacterium]
MERRPPEKNVISNTKKSVVEADNEGNLKRRSGKNCNILSADGIGSVSTNRRKRNQKRHNINYWKLCIECNIWSKKKEVLDMQQTPEVIIEESQMI